MGEVVGCEDENKIARKQNGQAQRKTETHDSSSIDHYLTRNQRTSASARMDNTRLNGSPTILSTAATHPARTSLSVTRRAFSPEEVTRCSYRDIGRIAGVMGGLGN